MNWGGGGRSPSLTSLFSSVKGCFFSYFSSKLLILKKSFTLVELSIVLLVLALLVSTLLVGRQIIDRAKAQQVISEIDYYTKNFQMFRDQYDFLPGALDEANCRKYPEFSMQPGTDKSKYPSQCDDPDAMVAMITNKYYTSYNQANKSMLDMVHAGLVENRSTGERRRKIYDVAEAKETTCINIRRLKGDYMTFSLDEMLTVKAGQLVLPVSKNICLSEIYPVNGKGINTVGYNLYTYKGQLTEGCNFNVYTDGSKSDIENYCINTGIDSSGWCGLINCNCDTSGVGYCSWCTYTARIGGYITSNLNSKTTLTLRVSDWGKAVYDNDKYMENVCETKTIEGEKRRSYLLNKDEITDNANRSTISEKIWITYSSGMVDKNMTYGIGGAENKIQAGESNVVVYFLFDDGKSEIEADGAVSYDLFDLMVKKLGEKKDNSVGNIIPINKSAGEGFNFAYIMR